MDRQIALARLEATEARFHEVEAQVERLKRAEEEAMRLFQRATNLLAAGASSRQHYESADYEAQTARQALDAAQGCQIDAWGGDPPLHGRVRVVEPSAHTRVSVLGVEEQRVTVTAEGTNRQLHWGMVFGLRDLLSSGKEPASCQHPSARCSGRRMGGPPIWSGRAWPC